MLKEASTKRLITYDQIEQKMNTFNYGMNDENNKPPKIRAKHLTNNHIVGSASQKLCLFKLMPIIFCDIVDELTNTLEIYICLREIISYAYAPRFRKSWLPYFHSLTIRFQSLMVYHLPELIIPKVHFVTEYPRIIGANGPATHFWCMRYEGKHLYFKQLAIRSFNFKNPAFTLVKRHQLRQCLMLSNKTYYNIFTETTSLKTIKYSQLPVPVQRLLKNNNINQAIFDECRTIHYKNVMIMKQSVFIEKLFSVEEEPRFVYILYLLKIHNVWKAVVEHLQIVGFSEKFWSYEVEFHGTLDLLKFDQFLGILPHGLDTYSIQGSTYINVLSRLTI